MTRYHLSRRCLLLTIVIFAAVGLTAAACTGVTKPEGWASPILSDDLLLVAHRDELFALDAETLTPSWAFPLRGGDDELDVDALYGGLAVTDNTVFVPAYDGNLYAIDLESGDIVQGWPFETDGPLIGGVAVSDETAYFGSSDGKVYALDTGSLELRWAPFEAGDAVWSTPAVAGDTLYVTSLDGRLYALDAESGREMWSFKSAAGVTSPPVVDEQAGQVYVGGLDSRLRAIDIETHEENWSVKADNWFWTRPLVVDGVVYAGALDGRVYAVDAATGEARWPQPFETEAPVRAAAVMLGGMLIIIDRDGSVHGVDPQDGTAAVDAPTDIGADVLADPLVRSTTDSDEGSNSEEIVLTTTEGELVRIDAATLEIVGRKKLVGD